MNLPNKLPMSKPINLPIHIAASGTGSRMGPAIEAMGFEGLPKHLLPTGDPSGETLIGRNLTLAENISNDVVVHVNSDNQAVIQSQLALPGHRLITDPEVRPLGPFTFATSINPGETAASVAGDVYLQECPWQAAVDNHSVTPEPITFLVGRVLAPAGSAVFALDNTGKITGFERPTEPAFGYRNIGLYIFTLTPPVVELVEEYAGLSTPAMEDKFALDAIAAGLVRAQAYPGVFFNTNNGSDYAALQAHTSTQSSQPQVALS
jgi:NDP-sugar pyrophosphorylase family protein